MCEVSIKLSSAQGHFVANLQPILHVRGQVMMWCDEPILALQPARNKSVVALLPVLSQALLSPLHMSPLRALRAQWPSGH